MKRSFLTCLGLMFTIAPAIISSTSAAGEILNPFKKLSTKNNVSHKSKYQTLYFEDDFLPQGSNPDPCFSKKLTCARTPSAFSVEACPDELKTDHLKDLNKCIWTVYGGYNTWDENKKVAFLPQNIRIENGILELTFAKNPGYDPTSSKLCGDSDGGTPSFRNTNCEFAGAGLFTKYKTKDRQGVNFLYGRVEILARIETDEGGVAALWAWPDVPNKGWPYQTKSAHATYSDKGKLLWAQNGEIDILESYSDKKSDFRKVSQSYHNWVVGSTVAPGEGHSWDTNHASVRYDEGWHWYGVETHPDKIIFTVDDEYTSIVKNGGRAKSGFKKIHHLINDAASYLIISLNSRSLDPKVNERLLIDKVRFYK